MAAREKIVVIGGGIGGLAAALALLKRGLDVEVHEQAPELKEVGAGIQISSNGTRVLYAPGLEDALKRVQVLPSGRVCVKVIAMCGFLKLSVATTPSNGICCSKS